MKIALVALLFLSLLTPATAKPEPQTSTSPRDRAHKAMHVILQKTGDTGARCTANAIGPHALLTADHCNVVTSDVKVDGVLAHIEKRISDGHDHSILLLSGIQFSDTVSFSSHSIEQGDRIVYWGNPGPLFDQYREGYMTGVKQIDDNGSPDTIQLFDVRGGPGDSGSAVLDPDYKIVGVVSVGYGPFMGSYPMRFTPDQINTAIHF